MTVPLSRQLTVCTVSALFRPMLGLPGTAGSGQFFGEEFFIRQDHMVLSRQHFVWQPFQCIARHRGIRSRTQDQANGWVLSWQRPVLTCVITVHVHLTHVGVIELGELEIDDNKASQTPMKKQKIYPEPAFTNPKATLAAHERKIATQLKKKVFEAMDQCLLQLTF
jgi:hypothetical protein